jgi:hypothetical protein
MMGGLHTLTQPPPFPELLSKYDKNKDGLLGTDELTEDFILVNRGGSRGAGNMAWKDFIRPGKDGKPRTFNQAEWEAQVNEAFARVKEHEKMFKSAAFAVPIGGFGDVTNSLAWTDSKGVPEVPSPLFYRGHLYYVRNGGLFTCRNPQTGKALYDERVGAEGGYYASPVAADGRIYIASDRGVVTVLQAGATFKVLSRTDLKEIIMATPAIVDDKVYVRGSEHLWAFGGVAARKR